MQEIKDVEVIERRAWFHEVMNQYYRGSHAYCTCDGVNSADTARCPQCGTNQMWGTFERETYYDVFFLQTVDDNRFTLFRYRLAFQISDEPVLLKSSYYLWGYLEYDHTRKYSLAHLREEGGEWGETKDLYLLYQNVERMFENSTAMEQEISKCTSFHTRTGFREYAAYRKRELETWYVKIILEFIQYYQNGGNPEVELLLKAGLERIASCLIAENVPIREILLKATEVKKLFVLPFPLVRALNGWDRLTAELIRQMEIIYTEGKGLTLEGLAYLNPVLNLDPFLRLVRCGYTSHELISYLQRAEEYQDYSPNNALETLGDYIRMGVEGRIPYEKFPRHLRTAHDTMVQKYGFIGDEVTTRKFAEAIVKVKNLEYEGKRFCIRIPLSPLDLIREGEELHHCVAFFIRMMADGETVVLFLRKNETPDTPYYTVEVKDGRIRQVRGMCSQIPDSKEVKDFLAEWARAKNL